MCKEYTSEKSDKDISFINDIQSIAIIGPSKKRDYFFLKNHAENFKGNIYVVHPTVKEITGFDKDNIYSSLEEIPNNVDFAFIAVPPSQILNVMDDCVKKKVKLVTVFTSEFSDSGTDEGKELERELLQRAQNRVRILGPNGLGIFYPKMGITWRPQFPTTPGNIGFIAQSGGICNIAIYSAQRLGINFSKVFSFGNGADLDFVDLLHFFSNDPETDIILCYLEGIKKGRSEYLRRVLEQNKKPIIALKGGRSKTGALATKTHTASISGDDQIWEAFFKQYNIIEVDSLEQLLYTARLIDYYGIFELNKLAVFSISGGYGVILVDLLENAGMEIPPFSPEIQEQLSSKFFMPGTSAKNPLDLAAQFFFSKSVNEIIDIALSDKNIEGLILDMPSFYFSPVFRIRDSGSFESDMFKSLTLGHKYKKPVIPIIQRLNRPEDRRRIVQYLSEKKVPVFGDPLEFIPLLPKISNYKRKLNNKMYKE